MFFYSQLKFEILNKDDDKEIDPPLSIIVEIQDINDNAPTFQEPLVFNVKENTEKGEYAVVHES